MRLTNDKLYDEAAKSTAENALNTWQSTRSEHPELQSEKSNYQTETAATDNITLIKNPVNDANKEPYVWFQLSRLMNEAKREVMILTPTIGLSPDMLSDIEIWVPSKSATHHPNAGCQRCLLQARRLSLQPQFCNQYRTTNQKFKQLTTWG